MSLRTFYGSNVPSSFVEIIMIPLYQVWENGSCDTEVLWTLCYLLVTCIGSSIFCVIQ